NRLEAETLGDAVDDGREVEKAIGDVEGQDTVVLQACGVNVGGFGGEQVEGDGPAGEGVDGEDVETLGLSAGDLFFEAHAGVAGDEFDVGVGIVEVGEVLAGDVDDLRIEFVETEVVAFASVGGHGACAETDDGDV